MSQSQNVAPAVALYRVERFAELVQMGPSTVRRHISAGRIRSVRLGRSVRIPASEIERLTAPTRIAS